MNTIVDVITVGKDYMCEECKIVTGCCYKRLDDKIVLSSDGWVLVYDSDLAVLVLGPEARPEDVVDRDALEIYLEKDRARKTSKILDILDDLEYEYTRDGTGIVVRHKGLTIDYFAANDGSLAELRYLIHLYKRTLYGHTNLSSAIAELIRRYDKKDISDIIETDHGGDQRLRELLVG